MQVSTSADDAEEGLTSPYVGTVLTNSVDLELGYDSGNFISQIVGLRFNNIAIPQGSTINTSRIDFNKDTEIDMDPATLYIYGEDADDASTFVATDTNLSSRTQTSASVTWSPGTWSVEDNWYSTDDISTIVQEIVNRAGWVSGNSIVFLIDDNSIGTGKRAATSYDSDSSEAPKFFATFGDPISTPQGFLIGSLPTTH